MDGETGMLKGGHALWGQLIVLATGNESSADTVQLAVECRKTDDEHKQIAEHEHEPEHL